MKPSDILEGLDPQQKAAGQLGPTEEVKNNNIGKLVGANENFINTDVQAVVSEEDLDEHNHLIGIYRKGESQFQLWNEGQYQYKLTSMVGGVPKQYKQWNDFDLEEVKASLIQSGFQSMRTFTDESTKMDKNNLPKQYWNRDTQSIGPTPDAGLTYADPDEDGVHYPDYGNTKFGNTKFKGWRPSVKPQPQPQPTSVCKRKTDQQYANQLSNHYAQVYDKIRITFNRRKDIFTITGYNGAETDHIKYTIDPTTCKLRMMSRISVENESINQGLAEASDDLGTSAKELARQKAETETYKKYKKSKEEVAAKNLKNYQLGNVRANYVKEQGVAEGKVINTYLWHGSRQKIPMLEPRQSVDTGGAAGSNQNAIYATSDPKVAIAMGLTTAGSDTGMFPNDPQMVLFSGKIRKGEYVYLHKLPFNGPDEKPQFVQGGNSREFHSIPGVEGIKPIEIKEIPVNKYLNLIRKATPSDLKLRKKYMKEQGVAEGSELRKKYMKKAIKEVVHPDIFDKHISNEPTEKVRMDDFEFKARPFRGRILGHGNLNDIGLSITAHDRQNVIGWAHFVVKSDEKGNQWLESEWTEVDDDYMSRGVAAMMYAFAKSLGNDVKPSPHQSTWGKRMWKKWGKDAKHLVGEQGVAEGESNRAMWDRVRSKGIVPGIDREKYTERPGLEGPFHTKTGKVVYYDKQEGKYYDPDTDFYISHDDYQAMNEQGVAEGSEQQLNEIAPLLALGARLFMASAPKIAQVFGKVGQAGARGVGQAAKAGAGIAAKNAGQIGIGAGAYEIGSSVADIVKDITTKVGAAVDEKTIFDLATLAFKYAIPAGIVLAILYGGKKAIDSLFADPKTQQGVAEGECPMCVESGTTCKECSMQMESLSQILRNAGIKKV